VLIDVAPADPFRVYRKGFRFVPVSMGFTHGYSRGLPLQGRESFATANI
jgi:hypothetical protein